MPAGPTSRPHLQRRKLRCAAAQLEAWVLDKGGKVDGASIVQDTLGGCGLQARAPADAGTQMVLLPPHAHLTYDQSADPRLLALINQAGAPGLHAWGDSMRLFLNQASCIPATLLPCKQYAAGTCPPSCSLARCLLSCGVPSWPCSCCTTGFTARAAHSKSTLSSCPRACLG